MSVTDMWWNWHISTHISTVVVHCALYHVATLSFFVDVLCLSNTYRHIKLSTTLCQCALMATLWYCIIETSGHWHHDPIFHTGHYPDTVPINHFLFLVMPSANLGADKYQCFKFIGLAQKGCEFPTFRTGSQRSTDAVTASGVLPMINPMRTIT